MGEIAVNIYMQMLEVAIPFALVFNIGNIIVNSVLTAIFGGKLCIKS